MVWKNIDGFPGYQVSSQGQVRSWLPERNNAPLPKEPRILKFLVTKAGYRQVNIYRDGKRRVVRIPILVAEAFHGPRPQGLVIRHLNGNRVDDRAVNLKWGTSQENSDDMRRHGTWLHGEPVHTSKLTETDVREILESNESNLSLGHKYGVTPGSICHIRKGRSWKHISGKDYYARKRH